MVLLIYYRYMCVKSRSTTRMEVVLGTQIMNNIGINSCNRELKKKIEAFFL